MKNSTRGDNRKAKRIKVAKFVAFGLVSVGLAGVLGVQVYVNRQIQDLPKVTYTALHSDSSSNMYASNGTKIWSSGENRRIYVPMRDVPNSYVGLLLSTEDQDYYHHPGFSVKGIANAVFSSLKAKVGMGEARGGSTIEQQLIKLTVFSTNADDRTVSRKVKELYLASQLYHNYSRNQILEFYINKINMGENSYGAQTIARTYFGKTLKQCSISQLAIIAGLGQAPATYNLYTNPKAVEQRRYIVLQNGLKNGAITKAQYNKAKATPIKEGLKPRFWDSTKIYKMAGKHNAFVQSTLNQVASEGYNLQKTPLQIHTTLNIKDDDYLRDLFNKNPQYFKNKKQQSSATIVNPRNGAVIAQIGGRYSTKFGDLNRATQTNRSTGSSIKPVLDYGPAMEYLNWGTAQPISGAAYHYPGTNVWAKNFDGSTTGMTTLQKALRQSYNPPAIRTLQAVGYTKARTFINNLGLNPEQKLYDSSALGVNASTAQMASAIGAFGQGGVYHKQTYISSLKFPDDSVKSIAYKPVQAMRPSVAYTMTKVLEGVPSKQGTLPQSRLTSKGIYAAAKTGTVGYPDGANVPSTGEIAMDYWTEAYTKSFSFSIWNGYDKPMEKGHYIDEEAIFNQKQVLYKRLMKYLAKHNDTTDWVKPKTVAQTGSGLDANYKILDKVSPGDVGVRLDRGKVKTHKSYKRLGKSNKYEVHKIYAPNQDNYDKSDYDKNWKKELNNEKRAFYRTHSSDDN